MNRATGAALPLAGSGSPSRGSNKAGVPPRAGWVAITTQDFPRRMLPGGNC